MNKIKIIVAVLLVALIGLGVFGLVNKKANETDDKNKNTETKKDDKNQSEEEKIIRGTYEYYNTSTLKFDNNIVELKFFNYPNSNKCYNGYYDIYFNGEIINEIPALALTSSTECLREDQSKHESITGDIYKNLMKNTISVYVSDRVYNYMLMNSKTEKNDDVYIIIMSENKVLKTIKIVDGLKTIKSTDGCNDNKYTESSYFLYNNKANPAIYYLKRISNSKVEEYKITMVNNEVSETLVNTCNAIVE